MPAGALVISFDFELAWGMRPGAVDWTHYAGIEKVRDIVTRLLTIFEKYNISATWATVGHLMLREQDCQNGRFTYDLPAPQYPWFDGKWYDAIPGFNDPGAECFYAPDVVQQIADCPVEQEIASHTFSHAVIGDPACNVDVARAEFATCQEIAGRWGRPLKSVVFPRNRVGHLPVLKDQGFSNYRDSNSEWYWFRRASAIGAARGPAFPAHLRLMHYVSRVLRYIDEKLRFTPPLPPARHVDGLWAIPHSMFFPGLTGVSKFVSAKDRSVRAIRGLHRARDRRRIFSLYTHPHNFLSGPDLLLGAFESVCREAAEMRDKGDFLILTMEQVAQQLESGQQPQWMKES